MAEIGPDVPAIPSEVLPTGSVVLTPSEATPYQVVFKLGDEIISTHPVLSLREGENLIREELPNIRVSSRDPNRHA